MTHLFINPLSLILPPTYFDRPRTTPWKSEDIRESVSGLAQVNAPPDFTPLANSLIVVGVCSVLCALIWAFAIVRATQNKYGKGGKPCG